MKRNSSVMTAEMMVCERNSLVIASELMVMSTEITENACEFKEKEVLGIKSITDVIKFVGEGKGTGIVG